MKHTLRAFTVAVIFALFSIVSSAYADDPIYTGIFNNTAVSGYDTVSYFENDGVPVKGSKDFQTKWQGANWLFSSKANLDKFSADPKKYAPQYGGYCAWAVAHDNLVKADPLIYTIENGKLYLNYDEGVNQSWLPRKEELIPVSDKKYPVLVAN